jgi:spermidine synthase
MRKYHPFIFALLLIGFTSVIAQVLLIRELMIVFYGNELSSGILLGNWLLLTAFGAFLIGKISDKFRFGMKEFIFLQLSLALILPLEIFLTRSIKILFGVPHGELLGMLFIFLISFLILLPLSTLLGAQFSLGSKIISRKEKNLGIGKVYLYESIGWVTGGLILHYLLFPLQMKAFQIIFLLAIINLISASLLLSKTKTKKFSRIIIVIFLIIFFSLFLYSTKNSLIEDFTRNLEFPGSLILSEDSIYGNFAITQSGEQKNFYQNGLLMFTSEDIAKNEELIHFSLLEHPNPRNVLLIGGGVSGVLREILKHPSIEKITYLELNPLVIKRSQYYISQEDSEALKNPKVFLIYGDARFFVKTTKEKYDVIIINLPDPSTAQLNRFYTLEFFTEAKKILESSGEGEGGEILLVKVPFSESYIGKETQQLDLSIFKTLKEVFRDVKVIPAGEEILFLGSDSNVLTYDSKILTSRLHERNLSLKFISEGYLNYKLSPEKINFALSSIQFPDEREAIINSDLRPVSYYLTLLISISMFYPHGTTSLIHSFENLFWFIPLFLLIFLSFSKFKKFKRRNQRIQKIPILAVMFTTGFSSMIFEIVLLLGFQIFYGYLYYKVSLIITAFMFGLALGSFLSLKIILRKVELNAKKILIISEFFIVFFSLTLPLIFIFLTKTTISLFYFEILFPTLSIISGVLVGLEFPLASRIYFGELKKSTKEKIGEIAGILYSSDLIGAFFGAILTSAILIPAVGIINICILSGVLNFITGIFLLFSDSQ